MAALSRSHSHYLAALVSAVLFVLALTFVVLRLFYPSDGARLWLRAQASDARAVLVAPLVEPSADLRANDLVVSAAGRSIRDWADRAVGAEDADQIWAFDQTVVYTVLRDGSLIDIPVTLHRFPLVPVLRNNIGSLLLLTLFELGAVWIWSQRRREGATQTLLLATAAFGAFTLCWYVGMDVASFIGARGLWLGFRLLTFIMLMTASAAMLHFAILISRLPLRQPMGRRLTLAIYLAPYPLYFAYAALTYNPSALLWMRQWEIGVQSLLGLYLLLALLVMGSALRSLRSSRGRRRAAILLITFVMAGALGLVYGVIPTLTNGQIWLQWGTMPVLALPIAVGMGIAVAFYRLFDIRVALQRTVVWSALTGLTIVVYGVVVGGLSTLFQLWGNPIVALVATGLTAIVFEPLREWLNKRVSALLFGERDTPYRLILSLTQQLESALAPNDAMTQIVRTIGEGLKLPYAAIELKRGHRYVSAASWGSAPGRRIEYPIMSGDQIAGRLLVAPRSRGEPLTPGDQQLLAGLVYHAEVAIQTARLTADLQQSREKLVHAREEERRRLRRDLHDGLGPALASLALQLDAARNLLVSNPPQVDPLLVSIREQAQTALTDIRRLVYELRPPTLDEMGLIPALRESAGRLEQSGIQIEIDAPDSLPPLPAAAEVAAYRIVMEALTNVVRHAHAQTCRLALKLDADLTIEVLDDGCGLPDVPHRGVGLGSMMERAAEMGGKCLIERRAEGGTRVIAHLPI